MTKAKRKEWLKYIQDLLKWLFDQPDSGTVTTQDEGSLPPPTPPPPPGHN